ncbi:hypothetical protein H8957_001057 [Semnopithecus entellus]|uniref:ras-like protein family member 10A isoform X1 n=1 Tax=Trachypithecus francoisi TaxID=54180 RepID=UPI00141B8CCD|nr:ras-like protein family member 10A isoform X1 [Trachypithecus francoisi]XP_033089024.1 ras-like protein family member 10A isoform X1 [Trachypithecus francoisi]
MGGSLRVAVLGAPGVGKTAIIRQFLFGDYPERHRPTDGPRLYRPAVLLDGAVYDLSIRDGDVAGPGSSPGGPEEWPDPKDWSLQDTDAFVLVYDICSPDSFDYVKALRQRIAETRWGRGRSGGGEPGQIWPGLCLRGVCRVSQRRGPGLRPSPVGRSSLCVLFCPHGPGVRWEGPLAVGRECACVCIPTGGILRPWGPRHRVSHLHSAPRPAGAPEAPILVVGNKRDRQRLRFGPRRALAALVRRGWRCGYLECSAKYNWHVLRLFRELLRCALVRARPAHPALRLQGALHPARCSLM